MRDIVDYLHSHDQHYSELYRHLTLSIPYNHTVLMTDPAVAYTPDDQNYGAYHRGKDLNIYLKAENGSDFLGLVWPG